MMFHFEQQNVHWFVSNDHGNAIMPDHQWTNWPF